MPDIRNANNGRVAAGLGAIIKQALDEESFVEYRDLKAHLEDIWGLEFVQKHNDLIMEIAWKHMRTPSQETLLTNGPPQGRPPSPALSNDQVPSPICRERFATHDPATPQGVPYNAAGRSGHETKTNTLRLHIFNKTQAAFLFCVAIQGDTEIGCIVQQDAELLNLDPAEKLHVLRWTMIDDKGEPGTMRSSAFHIVPAESISKNVILGRDWQTREALANSATGPDTRPPCPCTGTPSNVRDAQLVVSQEPAVVGQHTGETHAAFAFQMLHDGYGRLTQEITRGFNNAYTETLRETMKAHLPPTLPTNSLQQPQPCPFQHPRPSQQQAPHSWSRP